MDVASPAIVAWAQVDEKSQVTCSFSVGGSAGGRAGGDGQRLPQSIQSEPRAQKDHSLPGPPSSQPPSLARSPILATTQTSLQHGSGGEGGGGE
eukprot:4220846-Prymnesium_polylepis.1